MFSVLEEEHQLLTTKDDVSYGISAVYSSLHVCDLKIGKFVYVFAEYIGFTDPSTVNFRSA